MHAVFELIDSIKAYTLRAEKEFNVDKLCTLREDCVEAMKKVGYPQTYFEEFETPFYKLHKEKYYEYMIKESTHWIKHFDIEYSMDLTEDSPEPERVIEITDVWDLYRMRSSVWCQIRNDQMKHYFDVVNDEEYKAVKTRIYLERCIRHDRIVEADERHFDLWEKKNPGYTRFSSLYSTSFPEDRRLYVHSIYKAKDDDAYDERINLSPSLEIHDMR